ncbi:MAG: arsenate reductase ArsC [Permianibacter sp.]
MKKRVLFLCSSNAARSQMAEALLRQMAGVQFEVFSAGNQPTGVHPSALHALHELDVDPTGLRSKAVSEFRGQQFDYVITLCDKARQECETLPGAGEYLAWDFEDPVTSSEPMPFLRVAKALRERIKLFVLINSKG